MQSLAKQDQWLDPLTVVTEPDYLPLMLVKKRLERFGFYADNMMRKKHLKMGLVNAVVPVKELEAETVSWAREMLRHSPMALRLLKASLNAADDGLAGIQQLAGDATMLFYLTEEGQEGRNAYQEKREPNFNKFPKPPISNVSV